MDMEKGDRVKVTIEAVYNGRDTTDMYKTIKESDYEFRTDNGYYFYIPPKHVLSCEVLTPEYEDGIYMSNSGTVYFKQDGKWSYVDSLRKSFSILKNEGMMKGIPLKRLIEEDNEA